MGFEYNIRNIINIILQISHGFSRPLKSGQRNPSVHFASHEMHFKCHIRDHSLKTLKSELSECNLLSGLRLLR